MMKPWVILPCNRDKAAGLAAALLLHFVVLYGLWSYRFISPAAESEPVFVTIINPDVPVTRTTTRPVALKTVAAKPTEVREERLRPAIPAAQPAARPAEAKPLAVASSAEPAALPLPVAKQQPASAPVSLPAAGRQAGVAAESAEAQPVLLNNELSVSCTERPPPVYPKQSLRLNEQGKTVLLVELDEFGRAGHVEIKSKSGFPRLDEAALNAVKAWRCTPAKRNGVAVRSVAVQPFNFTIKGR